MRVEAGGGVGKWGLPWQQGIREQARSALEAGGCPQGGGVDRAQGHLTPSPVLFPPQPVGAFAAQEVSGGGHGRPQEVGCDSHMNCSGLFWASVLGRVQGVAEETSCLCERSFHGVTEGFQGASATVLGGLSPAFSPVIV